MSSLEAFLSLDDDVPLVEGRPLIKFGERYTGSIVLRNPTNWQYTVVNIVPDDSDIHVDWENSKYVFPRETVRIPFQISTRQNRKQPFKLGLDIRGGFIT